MATVIKKGTCPACGCTDGEWREAKAGAASFWCPDCKYQGLAKSPKASASVRGVKAAEPAAAAGQGDQAPKKKSFFDLGWPE